VFYGASGSEAEALSGQHVVVAGGGNSAGQAAVHLSRFAAGVTILVRGASVAATMSDYLIREIEAHSNIAVRRDCEIVDATGAGRLEGLTVRDRKSGRRDQLDAAALFVTIGAEPRTDWLAGTLARDPRGFLLTGTDLDVDPGDGRLFMETSMRGVFAVGDARHGSVKRVAPAVGSGAIAVQQIHAYLAGP
jgi:thioredoxin reductase (NADPH)